MKKLKHIKLFESFESIKLSKTLNFINKESRESFIDSLEEVADEYDFPISKFNDDMFQYLPFKSALKKNVDINPNSKEICKHESEWIPGEFCQGGRIKRTWGTNFRMVECPGCKGTGFKPGKRVEYEVKLIKFWFNKEGSLVTVTGCDGQIRNQNFEVYNPVNLHTFSKDLSDYNEIKSLTLEEVKSLPTGSVVFFSNKPEHNIVSMVFKGIRRDRTYMLQDEFFGSEPQDDNEDISKQEWTKYAKASWVVGSYSDFNSAILLEPKVKVKSVPKYKPIEQELAYTWNNLFNVSRFRMSDVTDMEKRLKDAHFAIILDLDKLKKSEYIKVKELRVIRKERKEGAFIKPEDVKKANLERYISLLIKKFDASKGLSEITKILPRALGFTNSITFIMISINFSNLGSLIGYMYELLENTDDLDYYQRSILTRLDVIYKESQSKSSKVNSNIDAVRKLIQVGDTRNDRKSNSEYFEAYLELGDFINKKISSFNIENIFDMELIIKKLNSIRELINSSRVNSLTFLKYLSNHLLQSGPNSCLSQIDDITVSYPNCTKELAELRKSIDKII